MPSKSTKYQPLRSSLDDATELDRLPTDDNYPDHSPPSYDSQSAYLEAGLNPANGLYSASPRDLDDDPNTRYTRTCQPQFSSSAEALCDLLLTQAAHPPVGTFLQIKGHHYEQRASEDGKKMTNARIADFDFFIDISTSFCPRASQPHADNTVNPNSTTLGASDKPSETALHPIPVLSQHYQIHLASHTEVVYRGGLTRTQSLDPSTRPTTLSEWCTHYTDVASTSWLPCRFVLQRKPHWKTAYVVQILTEAIRKSNFKGELSITVESADTFTVFSPHWITKTRDYCYQRTWLWTLCMLSLIWVVTWPILGMLRRKWDVVEVRWPLCDPSPSPSSLSASLSPDSRYDNTEAAAAIGSSSQVSESAEDGWLRLWAPVVVNLAFRRQKGKIDPGMVERYMRHTTKWNELKDRQTEGLFWSDIAGFVDANSGLVVQAYGTPTMASAWGGSSGSVAPS